jgi:uncharacterized tellurite resistance protein B-like protein
MLAAIRRFIADMSADEHKVAVGEDEVQLAAGALLYHLVAVDGAVTDSERVMLVDLLSRRFQLDEADAEALVKAAESAEAEAVDLYAFTSVLKRRLEYADRARIIEMMWKLVYADGALHEFEDNAIWRVAELLGVSSETRIGLKQKIRRDAS